MLARLLESRERFLAFLTRRAGDRELAEELLQDAFARAIERGDTLRDDESVIAWFFRLLRNALVDHWRKRGVESRAHDAMSRGSDEATELELERAACACLVPLVSTLKPEYADAVRQIDLEERSIADYAEGVGITKNNAAVRLHRAREALHKQVVRACGACATHGCLDCTCKAASS